MLFLNGRGLDSLPLWLVMSDCLVRFSMDEDEEKRAGCFTSIVSCLSLFCVLMVPWIGL